MRDFLVLGVHSGHNAGAALLCGGRVLAAVSEERLVGFKNVAAYPRKSIDLCLQIGGVTARDIEAVALASFHTFTVEADDYVGWKRGERPSPFPRPQGRRRLAPLGATGRMMWSVARALRNRSLPLSSQIHSAVGPWEYTDYHPLDRRIERIVEHLGIEKSRITPVDHHRCHATYAFLASPVRDRVLVMVADQVGDFVNASVWPTDSSGELLTLSRNYTLNSLGRIYSAVTGLLGMRPLEDEHKVMGLAPHASFENASRYLPVFEKLIQVGGIGFIEPLHSEPCWKVLPELLRGARFDHIAGAVQLFLEKRMSEWIKAATRHTGLHDVILSGGVALNVKANHVVGLHSSVRRLHVPPASGDESLAIGAAQAVTLDAGIRGDSIPPLGLPYLGDSFSEAEARRACEALRGDDRYRVVEVEDRAGYVARRLSEGYLVGRFAGRMEFGPRALGNRSILADAFDLSVTSRLNRRVKHRDFWMPFAPAILAERADYYFDNPKAHDASTMTIAFPSTARAKREIPAALHSGDGSLRPQAVDNRNPGFHQILRRFESLTGRAGLLNTSFNRHREPIVHTPEDAVRSFVSCDLDLLDFDHFLVERIRERSE